MKNGNSAVPAPTYNQVMEGFKHDLHLVRSKKSQGKFQNFSSGCSLITSNSTSRKKYVIDNHDYIFTVTQSDRRASKVQTSYSFCLRTEELLIC